MSLKLPLPPSGNRLPANWAQHLPKTGNFPRSNLHCTHLPTQRQSRPNSPPQSSTQRSPPTPPLMTRSRPARDPNCGRGPGSSLSSLLFTLSLLFWAVGPSRPSLVRGLRPRNAPSPTTCLIDLVSTLAASAHSTGFRQTTSRHSHQIPAGAPPSASPSPSPLNRSRRGRPCACLGPPIEGTHGNARPGACPPPPSLPKPPNNFRHRWHDLPVRLFPPQIGDAPSPL